eukprot:gnl/TRDRNA2_/TRDRNA2_81000_c0_seq2.p2 gnl/TRDRNA2_/TRDRNA2_81000_c0~~gnl/TRDRNA2_/TRDRNA2_81000_c0_seq2.p2  ORF type:complete len:142 (-),score=38.55 gnl/TRDRNA2_/TRDRNA2_81000_c0_seq2:103-528(-)
MSASEAEEADLFSVHAVDFCHLGPLPRRAAQRDQASLEKTLKFAQKRARSPDAAGPLEVAEESEDDDKAASEEIDQRPAQKKRRVELGALAAAAMEQWGLQEAKVCNWAAERRLPGIGFADVLEYRRLHPEEDISAALSDL